MKTLFYAILIYFLTISLYSNFQLYPDYTFKKSVITASDIFPEIQQMIYIYNAKNKTRVSLSAESIVQKLKRYGIEVSKNGVRHVRFVKIKKDIDLISISDELFSLFENEYPSMIINDIHITPKHPLNFLPEHYILNFKNSNLKRSQGFFYIETTSGKKIHFKYYIDAIVELIQSNQRIKRNDIIDEANTKISSIKFTNFRGKYIKNSQIGNVVAKTYIPKNRAILLRSVTKIQVVKRGQYIKGILEDGVIYIEVEVKILKSGGIGDIIWIETPNGNRLRAKIIDGKSVKIL
jgi:flagella basal body P-ring formation protein FlgA